VAGCCECGNESWFDSQQGQEIHMFSKPSKPALGPTQPPIQRVPGLLSPGVNGPRREADHTPSSTKVKNEWSYTSTPPYAFIPCTGTTPLDLTFKK
jgi:hypothetical protein